MSGICKDCRLIHWHRCLAPRLVHGPSCEAIAVSPKSGAAPKGFLGKSLCWIFGDRTMLLVDFKFVGDVFGDSFAKQMEATTSRASLPQAPRNFSDLLSFRAWVIPMACTPLTSPDLELLQRMTSRLADADLTLDEASALLPLVQSLVEQLHAGAAVPSGMGPSHPRGSGLAVSRTERSNWPCSPIA